MTKLCRTLFKYKDKMEMGCDNQLKKIVVHSNEMACRKGGVLVWTMSNMDKKKSLTKSNQLEN